MPLEERRVTAWLLATRVRREKRPIPILRTAFPEELVQCTSAIVLGRKREGYISPTHNIIPFFLFRAASSTVPRFCPPTSRSSHCFSDLPVPLPSFSSFSPLFSFVCSLRTNTHRPTEYFALRSLSFSLDRSRRIHFSHQGNFIQRYNVESDPLDGREKIVKLVKKYFSDEHKMEDYDSQHSRFATEMS